MLLHDGAHSVAHGRRLNRVKAEASTVEMCIPNLLAMLLRENDILRLVFCSTRQPHRRPSSLFTGPRSHLIVFSVLLELHSASISTGLEHEDLESPKSRCIVGKDCRGRLSQGIELTRVSHWNFRPFRPPIVSLDWRSRHK